jgi:hypothetical protein
MRNSDILRRFTVSELVAFESLTIGAEGTYGTATVCVGGTAIVGTGGSVALGFLEDNYDKSILKNLLATIVAYAFFPLIWWGIPLPQEAANYSNSNAIDSIINNDARRHR